MYPHIMLLSHQAYSINYPSPAFHLRHSSTTICLSQMSLFPLNIQDPDKLMAGCNNYAGGHKYATETQHLPTDLITNALQHPLFPWLRSLINNKTYLTCCAACTLELKSDVSVRLLTLCFSISDYNPNKSSQHTHMCKGTIPRTKPPEVPLKWNVNIMTHSCVYCVKQSPI